MLTGSGLLGCGRGRVDILGQRSKPRATLFDGLHNILEVAQRPGEAIIFRHHHHVAVAELIQHLVQLWTFGFGSAYPLGEQALRARRRQRVGLSVKVLVCG